ncbi:MAG: helix-turn-helix transcriptional regulator [Candidatus Eisenbacteria sp.]|nr:helix-turn-helix transcriptional regulator [Candidatus Eisenbacteria bacterium]
MTTQDWTIRLGNAVRSHRKAAGLTQQGLARLAGVGKSVVYDIEKGKATVRLETLMRVLTTLNIDLLWRSPLTGRAEGEPKDA